MDASKLRNILIDLTRDSEDISADILNTFSNNISANQTDEISANLEKIKLHFETSIVNSYSPSNIQILNTIGATDYFGITGLRKIESILTSNSFNIQKTVADLQAYLKKRTFYLNLVKTTNENLRDLNIKAHYHNDETFEVGLLMSTELTENKIINITKYLNRWDKIFKTLKELVDESPEDTEVNFVNNGSLQFFIDNSPHIAACLAVAVERIVKLYKNIIDIRAAKDKLKELGVSSGEQKVIEKQEKDLFNKEIEKISLDLIKEFSVKKIEQGRLNELKVAMKGHVTYIAKCIDSGMTIEINPPEIEEPEKLPETATKEEKAENKKMNEDYNKTLKQIEIVQKSMDTIKTIGKTGADIVKFLIEGEPNNDEE